MRIQALPYDHPDAVALDAAVQLEYTDRYGDDDGDATPLDPSMFAPPHGLYLVAYDEEGQPVATGGWRSHDGSGDEGYQSGDAELKRMYVIPSHRGRGLARRLLTLLEEDARTAGRLRMVLETGDQQPEAIALYTSCGYAPAPRKFGYYRAYESSRCFIKPLP
ncbi:GNAT family N-acetyltransferase [Streptomyces sp. NPDC057638]|uniref:GNAT family N-acetyltransferase n=1 Tax=Streptomyces sp. NPDC057638 TaxID=3346190 RepID=UPI0036A47167